MSCKDHVKMASVFVVVVDDVVVLVVCFFRSTKKGQTSILCDCDNQFSNLRVDCLLGPASVSCTHAFPAVWFSSVKVETRYPSTVRLTPQQSMDRFSVRF